MSVAEGYVAAKNSELNHLNHLINEQMAKSKATDEELKEVRSQLIEANLKMLPIVKVRSELFESREHVKQLKKINHDLQTKLDEAVHSSFEKQKLVLEQKRALDELNESYQKLNVLNMELESLKTAQNLDLIDAKLKIEKMLIETSTLSIKSKELTAERNRLKRIILQQSMGDRGSFTRVQNNCSLKDGKSKDEDDDVMTDEESSIDLCAPVAAMPTRSGKQRAHSLKSPSDEADSLIVSLIKQQSIPQCSSEEQFDSSTDCVCVSADIFNKVFG